MSDLRMTGLNKIIIEGRLTADPDLKYTKEGDAVCNLRIANSRYYKKRDGSKGEEVVFFDVVIWGKPAEWIGEGMKKGHAVIVEGSLKSDSWEDKDSGQKRTKLLVNAQRVLAMEWPTDKERTPDADGRTHSTRQEQPAETPAPRVIEEPVPEDEIPF